MSFGYLPYSREFLLQADPVLRRSLGSLRKFPLGILLGSPHSAGDTRTPLFAWFLATTKMSDFPSMSCIGWSFL